MYKITFNTQKCCWEIKLSTVYGLYWSTLKGKEFPNIISAEDYVNSVGLNKVYRNWNESYADFVMKGGVK
jgi:hypothetical protein